MKSQVRKNYHYLTADRISTAIYLLIITPEHLEPDLGLDR